MKGIYLVNYILANYFGLKEVPGPDSNTKILDIIQWAIPSAHDDSKTAWCAISLSYFINEAFGHFPKITLARKFLNVGKPVDEPQLGDLVIYWRGSVNSWKGHVGIFIREENDVIWTLGGNQSDQINIKPYSKSRLLKFRRL